MPVLKLREPCPDRMSDCKIDVPSKLGSYSNTVTAGREVYREGEGEMKVLKLPAQLKDNRITNLSYDLKDGYISRQDGGDLICGPADKSPGLDHILKWVLDNKHKLQQQSGIESASAINADFLTYRGIFTKIMTTPYEKSEGWIITATKYKGTIYLHEYMSEKKIQQELNRDERSNMCSYGGFRFEYYITEPVNPDERDQDVDFQHHSEYCCIARTTQGDHTLVYGAEMDCLRDTRNANDPRLSDFVEIKTTRSIHSDFHWESLVKQKMCKWWAQCYLIGTRFLVCGYRDDDMMVREIEVFKVSELRKMGEKYWSADVCLGFLNRFLDFVKETVKEDNPDMMYEFFWEPGRDVSFTKRRPTEHKFVIPKWYTDAL